MNWHLIDWIWHVRGCLSIPAQQTSSEVFCKIDPLFQEFGTTHELKNESLVFSKKINLLKIRWLYLMMVF